MIVKHDNIDIQYYITSYSGLFLNLIICNINHFHVHMSYSLRVTDYCKDINPKVKHTLTINQVNCFTKFDQNTIPQLDSDVLN